MGLATIFVLVLSNLVISALRNVIPDRVRIPSYITIIASLVTILHLLLQAYLPDLNKSLGIFIPLITVNCIILGRAEAFANRKTVIQSVADGLGMGVGFCFALFIIGSIRRNSRFRHILWHGYTFYRRRQYASAYPDLRTAAGGICNFWASDCNFTKAQQQTICSNSGCHIGQGTLSRKCSGRFSLRR